MSDICPTCNEPFDNGKHCFGMVSGTYLCNPKPLDLSPDRNLFTEHMLERFPDKSPMALLAEKMGIESEDDGTCPCCGHKEE